MGKNLGFTWVLCLFFADEYHTTYHTKHTTYHTIPPPNPLSPPRTHIHIHKGPASEGEPLPEALIWLLLTGEIPTKEQCDELTAELHAASTLPAHVEPLIRSLPKDMHPMSQVSSAR